MTPFEWGRGVHALISSQFSEYRRAYYILAVFATQPPWTSVSILAKCSPFIEITSYQSVKLAECSDKGSSAQHLRPNIQPIYHYGYEQVVLLTLQAGVDVLAIANQLQYNSDIAAKTIAIVKKLLNEGKLTPVRIDESYARIVKCKERLGKIQ